MSDPAEQVRQGHEYIKRTYGDVDPSEFKYTNGGYIPGGPTLTWIHPEECIVNRELKCVRPDHQHGVTT